MDDGDEYREVIEAAEGAELELCELCYNEERKIDFIALSCVHRFCKFCTEEYLQGLIDEGKVMKICCM